jgi:NTE family protein
VTAVDARTGEFVVFDAAGEAGLVDSVRASCAVPGVWPPVTIGDRRFIDGGMRSIANADLAAGYQRVVIVAPVTKGAGHITSPHRQAAALTAAGARVVMVRPDRAALRAIGRNVLDLSRRAAAAAAGPRPRRKRPQSGQSGRATAGRPHVGCQKSASPVSCSNAPRASRGT